MDRLDWRGAYLGLAVATVLVAVPVGLFLSGAPQEVGLLPDGDRVTSTPAASVQPPTGLTVGEAIRTRTFWQLCGIFFFVAVCVHGAAFHLVPLLTDRGLSGRTAALAASVFGLSSIAGRVGNGYLVDRYFAPRVAAVLFAGAAAGIALLWSGSTSSTVFVAAALLGLAIGAESDVMPFLISRYFGMRSMAELYGFAFGAYTLGNATGRSLFALGFDTRGSYQLPLAGAVLVLTLAIVGTLTLGGYSAAPGAAASSGRS
jgi:predicted MFS family arabinose efflux permease